MNFRHSAVYRKGKTVLQKPLRARDRWQGRSEESSAVLCNSFPKSGTHLLLQVLRVLPETRFYGSFLASVPSIRFRLRSQASHLSRLNALAPNEVMPAHLYYDSACANQIRDQRISHFFIYRDLRDVVVSEAFYLSSMAWWHRLSRQFRKCDSLESRLKLSINGLPEQFADEYPDIGKRFDFYRQWINEQGCCAIRFEDMVGEKREETLATIARFDQAVRGVGYDIDRFVADAIKSIDPKESHTFRSGTKQGWRKHFTPEISNAFNAVAGDVLCELGYAD